MLKKLLLILLINAGTLFGSGDCGVSQADWAWLQNYIAWSETWRQGEGFRNQELQLEYARYEGAVLWFFRSSRMIVSYQPKHSNIVILGSPCRREPWTKCVKRVDTAPEQISELLTGRKGRITNEEVTISEICRGTFDESFIQKWKPSPVSVEKLTLVAGVSEEVSANAKYWGSLKSAVVNNFNISDPLLFAVVEVQHSGSDRRLLVILERHGDGLNSVRISRTEEEGAKSSLVDNVWLIRKILRNGIRVQ